MRKLLLVLIAALCCIPMVGRADVNYRNGGIELVNLTPFDIEVEVAPSWNKINLAKGATTIVNTCCYAAGKTYDYRARYLNKPKSDQYIGWMVDVKPCVKDGTSFGWGVIVFRSQLPIDRSGDRPALSRHDSKCP